MEMVSVLLSVLCVSALAQCPNKDPDLFITAPKTMEALTGSCLMIPCSFRTKSEDQTISGGTIYGVWIKNDPKFGLNPNNVIYNSSKTVNSYPVTITGNLRQRNCTTLFSALKATYTDMYYFRIENGALKATAPCDPVQINVTDSPQKPRIEISGDLREDVSVTITCSASTPCPHLPPKLTWNLQAEPDNHREENTDGTFTTKIQETITLSDQHDGFTINCSASYPVTEGIKTEETQQTLNVSYAPKDTSASISPSAVVSAGSWVNLSCSSRARPPVSSFTWFQISSDGAKANVSKGAFYTFNATGGGVYYCVASNGLGAQPSPMLHLTVGGTEKLLSLGAVVGGITGVFVLLCMVVVTWRLKSKNQSSQTQVTTGEDSKTEDETIHYGEINFSSRRSKPSPDSHEQQQDTVYAQVSVSGRGNPLRQAAGGQDDIYAQIN
ncbi:B-cell receptor CD22-like isoform X2 [Betta splendens]|uniref:B-cell receptor CD22-like isoform X2 n=1 Tax=Betta splendens TaxID=158456 RepID=A0A8M1HDT8_BETSP|nr:B-cell receptor CD22-like isoform X2 [Betta splendens]